MENACYILFSRRILAEDYQTVPCCGSNSGLSGQYGDACGRRFLTREILVCRRRRHSLFITVYVPEGTGIFLSGYDLGEFLVFKAFMEYQINVKRSRIME